MLHAVESIESIFCISLLPRANFSIFFSSLSISLLSYDYQIQLISLSNIGCYIEIDSSFCCL